MKKGNSNSILKKPKLHFLEESGKTYLVISLKKYSQKHRRSYSCLPSKQQKYVDEPKQNISPLSKNPDYYYKKRKREQKMPDKNINNDHQIPLICKYSKELQKENMVLKKQNKVLYNYIRCLEETDQQDKKQKYKNLKVNFLNQLKDDYLLDEYDNNPFRSTLASTRH